MQLIQKNIANKAKWRTAGATYGPSWLVEFIKCFRAPEFELCGLKHFSAAVCADPRVLLMQIIFSQLMKEELKSKVISLINTMKIQR